MSVKVIHITGAAGSGTSTLGHAIGERFGFVHLDTDDFFWEQTDPPFTAKREVGKRQALLGQAMDGVDRCVVSGSLTEWGDRFIPRFDLVIYVFTPTPIRIQRLHEREYRRFGDRILPGGDMHEEHLAFIEWAGQYDTGGMDMRSAPHHREWLKRMACPVIKTDGTDPIEGTLLRLGSDIN